MTDDLNERVVHSDDGTFCQHLFYERRLKGGDEAVLLGDGDELHIGGETWFRYEELEHVGSEEGDFERIVRAEKIVSFSR